MALSKKTIVLAMTAVELRQLQVYRYIESCDARGEADTAAYWRDQLAQLDRDWAELFEERKA